MFWSSKNFTSLESLRYASRNTLLCILAFLFISLLSNCIGYSKKNNSFEKSSNIAQTISEGNKLFMPIDLYVQVAVFKILCEDNHKIILSSLNLDSFSNQMYYLNASFIDLNIEFVIRDIHPIFYEFTVADMNEFELSYQDKIMEISKMDASAFCSSMANSDISVCSIFIEFALMPGVAGLSKFPDSQDNMGIRINGLCPSNYLLAHEVGHYFGLLHTFQLDGDEVDDTPFGPISPMLLGTELDPNCDNIMTYSSHIDNQYFTKGQFNRMKKFIIGFRSQELYQKIPERCFGYENIKIIYKSALKKILISSFL